MRKRLQTASATLAVLILTACGGGSSAAPPAAGSSCVNAGAAHHAYVVVTHLDGRSAQRCVGFGEAQIGAEDLLQKSGIEYQTQTFSGLGKAVCQVDNEPKQFSECFPKDQPYWSMYVWSNGWQNAQTGLAQTELSDGQALGWRYVAPTASPAPTPVAPKK